MVHLYIITPVTALLAWTTLTVQPVSVLEWYVFDFHGEWSAQQAGLSSFTTETFSIGAKNTNRVATDKAT
ncbi:hypothetical protein ACHAQH_009330, partial [Verticillium albo-atrum]